MNKTLKPLVRKKSAALSLPRILFAMFLFITLLAPMAYSATTRVGNGDDGADLEGFAPLETGPIVNARAKAVAKLRELNVAGVAGLGNLLPEVENSKLYLATRDVPTGLAEDSAHFHSSMTGMVFARTFAEPHASTRFFPVAQSLDEKQLVALHIHEGLHRSIHPDVRENEAVVSKLTLSIVSPDATHDNIRSVASELLPQTPVMAEEPQAEVEHYQKPSTLEYRYRLFRPSASAGSFPVTSMHSIASHLYPFGGVNTPVGIGIEASVVDRGGRGEMGPLGLSFRLKLWSRRDFSIGIFGNASLNALSAEELKHSPFGRDVFTGGISMRKDLPNAYVENFIGISSGGTTYHSIGGLNYTYHFGEVINVRVRGGLRLGNFGIGGLAELHLADNLAVSGGQFDFETGRYRLLSVGPEFTFKTGDYAFALHGRFLVDSTKGANFDYLGNLIETGAAQGSAGMSATIFF